MRHPKGNSVLLLTHVRLTPHVDALFDANEIAVSIFMRNEPSGFVGRRTPSLTPRAQIIGTPQQRYVRTSPLHTLSTYCARFSGSLNPCASGSIREVMRATARGPLERTISTATLTMGMVMTQMSVGMLATYVWKYGSHLGYTQ